MACNCRSRINRMARHCGKLQLPRLRLAAPKARTQEAAVRRSGISPVKRHAQSLQKPCMIRSVSQADRRKNCTTSAKAAPSQPATSAELPQLLPLDDNYEVAHTFESYANWLIRGRLMLGRYPFVEPSRCVSRQTGEKQLSEILDAGIRTFACLQGELPPQQDIPLGGIDGFQSYAATASLMVKAREPSIPAAEMNGIRNRYVDRFLPPRKGAGRQQSREQTAEQTQAWPDSAPPDIQFLHEPITDLAVPADGRLEALLDNLEARVRRGENIYLHCWGGRGRAGTVGATLLHRLYGLPAEECLERVQRAYNTRKDPERRLSPETPEQIAFVKAFIGARS